MIKILRIFLNGVAHLQGLSFYLKKLPCQVKWVHKLSTFTIWTTLFLTYVGI